jgi:hypothetical protein
MAVEKDRAKGSPQITHDEREHSGSGRSPEERKKAEGNSQEAEHQRRERALDKTLADSFPTSDPPSSIPNPGDEDAA